MRTEEVKGEAERHAVLDCLELLQGCRAAWRAGHGDLAWTTLEKAEALTGSEPGLRLATLATRAGLHLLAEMFAPATQAAREAISLGEQLAAERELHAWESEQLADAQVTWASLADGGPYPAGGPTVAEALGTLDALARDRALIGTAVAARAVTNALVLRLDLLRPALGSTTAQVEAWVRVSEARTLLRDNPNPSTVLRAAVDLGITCGQWERAWSSAQEQIFGEDERNELIAVLAKAAFLAWHRGLAGEARELGARAQRLSVAVDHAWVRTYASLGGVIAAAAGAGDLGSALRSYTRCTTLGGHASRPHRAWLAATVALASRRDPAEVEAFYRRTVTEPPADLEQEAALVLADARGEDVHPDLAQRVLERPATAATQAQVHLALARTYRRQDRPMAASWELRRAGDLLHDWPGWLLAEVEREAALVERPVQATPAQRRVLDLVAEGLSNETIGRRLGLSARTVAVHVAALLRANALPSRTALVAQHLRGRALPPIDTTTDP